MKAYFHIILWCLLPLFCFAQNSSFPIDTTSKEKEKIEIEPETKVAGEEYLLGLFPKVKPEKTRGFSVSGFYRFFTTYTHIKSNPYFLDEAGGALAPKKSLFIGDDSQLPNLYLTFNGSPSKNTSFGMDLFAFQFLNGEVGESYSVQIADSLRPSIYDPIVGTRLGQSLGLNLGIQLNGSFSTDIGSFSVRMGGTHWYYLSDLTFASFRGYNRYTLFERNPWDPIERLPADRYQKFYSEGAISQDLRWGNRAFHGFILEGNNMVGGMSMSFLYGKTELNGGFVDLPNNSVGGRLKKEDKKGGFYSLNTFNSRTYSDSLANDEIGFNVVTFEFSKEIANIEVHAEIGAGRYFSPNRKNSWGEAINAKIKFPKKFTFIPIELQYFRISPEIINNNALFWNTSIIEGNVNGPIVEGASQVLNPFASSMVGIGQMTNNRTGVNLNGEVELDKLRFYFGYGIASEIEGLNSTISFSHPVNQLSRSRLWRWNFPQNVGPYNRYSVAYRDVFDVVNLIEKEDSSQFNKKHFANLEFQGKYKMNIGRRPVYLFYLGRYSSAQSKFSAGPVFTEKAYIRQYVSEFELYCGISKSLIWSNYFGYERTIANYDTEVDAITRRPRNQTGFGYGTGLELSLGKNASLTLQHRWFNFSDSSFQKDQFYGQETLIELKTVF